MNAEEFKEFGSAMIEYITNYLGNIRDRNVLPSVEPGYLAELLPDEAPLKPEAWQDILRDIETAIMPGVTHWNSPNFHAYYPAGCSYPSIVADMLSAATANIGFSWMSSPACTELEVITMNWLGKLLNLPKEFLNCSEGPGGGVIQGSASESTLICLLAARTLTTRRIKKLHPEWDEATIRGKLVAYSSDQSNSSIEKAGLLASMTMRLLPSDEKCRLRGSTLIEAMEKDEENGLIPCYVASTLGTTGTCAFDCLEEIGPICNEKNVWLHVDAAYAGAALACPEYRHLMPGLELVDSFSFNPHKWMLVSFDCSALWVKDSNHLIGASNVERIYLAHANSDKAPDYRHWQIPLGRRFRSLKLWFVMRIYGIEGIQNYLRNSVRLGVYFESLVRRDERFEVITEGTLGLICFRLKGDDSLTRELLNRLTSRKQIYVIAATYMDKLIVRFVNCTEATTDKDVEFAWTEIANQATEVIEALDRLETERSSKEIEYDDNEEKKFSEKIDLNSKINGLKIVNGVKDSPTIS
ncbi:aromatic-L-amino-acid decarboxylase-like [Athalia rosae]|uniref:aromatic-L-amino-acid decarboxylase-like n=1 Tax=Athalia rosae TaxID=37344 RepID=UPI0020336013|nr:aromatic-L-amino-acid decarboxylase-like [Athalia rosae]